MIEMNYTMFGILMIAACVGLGVAFWSMKRSKGEVITQDGTALSRYNYKVQKFTRGRVLQTKKYYYSIFVAGFILATCLGIQNFIQGYSIGSDISAAIISGAQFFIGDVILVILAAWIFPKWLTTITAVITLIGMILVSSWSGTAFYLGQGAVKDTQGIRDKQAQIVQLRIDKDALPHNWHTKRSQYNYQIQDIQDDINKLKENNNSINESNAIFVKGSEAFSIKRETMEIISRSSLTIFFIFGSITLGGMTRVFYTKKQFDDFKKNALAELRNEQQIEEQITSEERTVPVPPKPRKQRRTRATPKRGTPKLVVNNTKTLDSGTRAIIEDMILNGTLKPSTRKLKEHGIGTDQASELLRELADSGYLEDRGAGVGYRLIVSEKSERV